MFVGFIAVIVILLVIVGIMSLSSTTGSNNTRYITEAKKVQELVSNLKAETMYYYSQADLSYKGLKMSYYGDHEFAPNLFVASGNMSKDDWDNWPTVTTGDPDLDTNGDGELDSPYTGGYIKLGGPAGDEMRIIATPISSDKNVGLFIMKKKVNDVPDAYEKILEKVMTSDTSYIGG